MLCEFYVVSFPGGAPPRSRSPIYKAVARLPPGAVFRSQTTQNGLVVSRGADYRYLDRSLASDCERLLGRSPLDFVTS